MARPIGRHPLTSKPLAIAASIQRDSIHFDLGCVIALESTVIPREQRARCPIGQLHAVAVIAADDIAVQGRREKCILR